MLKKYIVRFVFTSFFLLAFICLKAQVFRQSKADSLEVELKKSKPDTGQVFLLYQLAQSFYYFDSNKSLNYAERALELSKKIHWKTGIADAYHALGLSYWSKYDFNNALDAFGKAFNAAVECNDKPLQVDMLINIGICYSAEDEFATEYHYLERAYKIASQINDKKRLLKCEGYMGGNLLLQSKFRPALDAFLNAYKGYKELGDNANMALLSGRLSEVYLDLGDLQNAMDSRNRALSIYNKINNKEGIIRSIIGIGSIYREKKDFGKAMATYQHAQTLIDHSNDKLIKGLISQNYYFLALCQMNLGLKALKDKRPESADLFHKALYFAGKSNNIAKADGNVYGRIDALKLLQNISEIQGQFGHALSAYKEYIIIRDKVRGSEKQKEYIRHQSQFEFNKRKDSLNYIVRLKDLKMTAAKSAVEAKLRQRTIYAVLVLAALLFIASYFVYKNRLQKLRFSNQIAKDKLDNQLKEIEFESRLTELTLASLKSQMNPHFIFNCLNSIKLYIERNDTELASLYISKFSKLVRDILDISRSEKISLAKELELIELYLAMECMRFKEKLIYTIDIDQSVDADFIEFPPMLLQPYVENAIWHGLMPKAEGGLLTISVRKTLDEKHLLIVISDNGIGREGSALLKGRRSSTHTSHGGKISDERIAMFNARYKSGIEVETDDLLNADNQATGTMVTIKFLYHEIFESSFSGR